MLLLPFTLLVLLFRLVPLTGVFVGDFEGPTANDIAFTGFAALFADRCCLVSVGGDLFISLLSTFVKVTLTLLNTCTVRATNSEVGGFCVAALGVASGFRKVMLTFTFVLLLKGSKVLAALNRG